MLIVRHSVVKFWKNKNEFIVMEVLMRDRVVEFLSGVSLLSPGLETTPSYMLTLPPPHQPWQHSVSNTSACMEIL